MTKAVTPKSLVAAQRRRFGEDAALLMSEAGRELRGVVPSRLAVLDRYVLGVGGLPYGRIVEMYGAESSGKTTLMNIMLAGAQADGGIAALIETENSYDPEWAKFCGLNVDDLILMQPNYLDGDDGALAQTADLIERLGDTPAVVALDSVAATMTKREFKEGITGEAKIAEAARAWSESLRVLVAKLAKSKAALLLVNQVRAKPGVMYGPTETTPGGNAIKFYATARLSVSHGKKTPEGNGRFMHVMAMKNKVAPPYRKATLRLDFDQGFNERWAILDHAKEMGCVDAKCRSLKEALVALNWTDIDGGADEPAEA